MNLYVYFYSVLNPHIGNIKKANTYEEKCNIIIDVLREHPYFSEPIGGDDKKFIDQCADGVRANLVANMIIDILSSHDNIKDFVMSAKNIAKDEYVSTEVNTILEYVKELLGVKSKE